MCLLLLRHKREELEQPYLSFLLFYCLLFASFCLILPSFRHRFSPPFFATVFRHRFSPPFFATVFRHLFSPPFFTAFFHHLFASFSPLSPPFIPFSPPFRFLFTSFRLLFASFHLLCLRFVSFVSFISILFLCRVHVLLCFLYSSFHLFRVLFFFLLFVEIARNTKEAFGSLYAIYKPEHWNWEGVIISRRLLIASLAAVVPFNSSVSIFLTHFYSHYSSP
jgi:hypothetical protein